MTFGFQTFGLGGFFSGGDFNMGRYGFNIGMSDYMPSFGLRVYHEPSIVTGELVFSEPTGLMTFPRVDPFGSSFRLAAGLPRGFMYDAQQAFGSGVGVWPDFKRFGGFQGYQEALLNYHGNNGLNTSKLKEPLPAGANSPDHAERGAAYVREMIGNGRYVSSDRVLKDVLGEEGFKDKGAREKESKSDTILRNITNLMKSYAEDGASCREFTEQWERYRDMPGDEGKIGRIRALFDPKGDGSHIPALQNLLGQNELAQHNGESMDLYWKRVAETIGPFLNSPEVIKQMGDAMYDIAKQRKADPVPITDANSGTYATALEGKGYTPDEAKMIASMFGTDSDAARGVGIMQQQQHTPTLRQYQETVRSLEEEIKGGKLKKTDKEYKERELEQSKRQVAITQKTRATQFLDNYCEFIRDKYGITKDQLGYNGTLDGLKLGDGKPVVDVVTAARWVQEKLSGLGKQVTVPEIPAAAAQAETPDDKSKKGAGNGVRTKGDAITVDGTEDKFHRLDPERKGTVKGQEGKKTFKFIVKKSNGAPAKYCEGLNEGCYAAKDVTLDPLLKDSEKKPEYKKEGWLSIGGAPHQWRKWVVKNSESGWYYCKDNGSNAPDGNWVDASGNPLATRPPARPPTPTPAPRPTSQQGGGILGALGRGLGALVGGGDGGEGEGK